MQFKKPSSSRISIVGEFLKDNQSLHTKGESSKGQMGMLSQADPVGDDIVDRILKHLEDNGAMGARQIFKDLDISTTAGMNLLDQMDRNGFLRRDKDEQGRTVFTLI